MDISTFAATVAAIPQCPVIVFRPRVVREHTLSRMGLTIGMRATQTQQQASESPVRPALSRLKNALSLYQFDFFLKKEPKLHQIKDHGE